MREPANHTGRRRVTATEAIAFLAERGFEPSLYDDGSGMLGWVPANSTSLVAIAVFLREGRLRVTPLNQEAALDLPADAPDLLERLGATLDGLGV